MKDKIVLESDLENYASKQYTDGVKEDINRNIGTISSEISAARTVNDRTYSNLKSAMTAAISEGAQAGYAMAKEYSDGRLANYESVSWEIVEDLTSEGYPDVEDPHVATFYLVPNKAGTGYDKYVWIKYYEEDDDESPVYKWDVFGSATTIVVDSLDDITSPSEDVDYIVYSEDGCLYYKYIDNDFKMVGGSTAQFLDELPEEGNSFTDYFVKQSDTLYLHYRYVDESWVIVGGDCYSKSEMDEKLSDVTSQLDAVEEQTNSNSESITSVSQGLTNLQQEVSNIDTEGYQYSATYEDNVFSLVQSKGSDEEVVSSFTITGGGGGGTTSTSLTLEKITASPLVVTPTDKSIIRVSYSSVDTDGETYDGNYTLKVGNTIVSTGVIYQGEKEFDVTDYITIGTQKVTLTVEDGAGSKAAKSWTVQMVDVRLESSFSDRITYPINRSINFTYTPYGSVSKTIHFILDGEELESVVTPSSGILQQYTLSPQSHGAHLLECYITAVVNGLPVETEHIYKDIIWYDDTSTTPVVGCIYRCLPVAEEADFDETIDYYYIENGLYALYEDGIAGWNSRPQLYYNAVKANQYDTTSISYVVHNPNTNSPTVVQTIDGVNSTLTMNTYYDTLAYKTADAGVHTVNIACGSTSVGIIMDIQELDIDVSPITANLAFDFNPSGYSNSSENRLWVDENDSNVALSVSDNFDWSNGGYQLDSEGNRYFCVKAGTTATFSYDLFGTDPKTQGMEFKLIFKTTNVRSADAQFLSCVDGYSGSNVGLQMNTHEAYLRSSSDSLYIPYSEEDKIEFEFNINPLDIEDVDATSIIMTYEDGVGMRPMIYDAAHRLYQYTPAPIVIGSQNCDVHIYRMKAYTSSLTDSNILSNFIADASSADEIIARYNRNQIYDENNNLTPEVLANACPDLKIIKIECPQFTNNKSNFVKYTNVQCIHKNGDPVKDNWTFTNCYHSGQGTTSNEYGYSGRNIDIICCMDGVNQYSSKITFDPDYKTTLVLGDGTRFEDGTGKVSLSRNSVPNNWFNIKVNIASSENANNALMQKRYNDYLPYTPASKKRDSKVKNDMEFFNCVVFVRETGNANGETVSRREFTDSNWHFYAIGNIGDSKKTDATRANDPDDMKEFCIEISDNTLPNAAFQSGVYAEYTEVEEPVLEDINSYYELDVSVYKPTSDTSIIDGKTYYVRENINYNGVGSPVFPITEEQWNSANNAKRINLQYSFDGDNTDDYAASFEFRYDMGGETRDGDTTGLSSAEQDAQRERNKQIFRDFYKWVVTASDADFANQLNGWFIKESALYWYLFTERYTMIDNRSKNTFWHFGDTGEYRPVPCPSSTFMDYYYERSGTENNYTYTLTTDESVDPTKTYYWSYAFEMWDYDNDTSLGINNSGELTMTYGKEDIDYYTDGDPSSGYIFNAAESIFWRRIRLLMHPQLCLMYQTLDSSNCWSSESLIEEYDKWQSQFPEELWRLDIERKYYRTYRGEGLNAGATPSPTPRYLQEMMNGRKKYQRRQFERDQASYMGTKYLSSTTQADKIEFRCNTPRNVAVEPNYDLTIVPYSDMYLSVKFGNIDPVQIRAKAGVSYTVKCPLTDTMADTMFIIYCASRIQALNDVSACYIHDNDFSAANKLQTLVIGNQTSGYSNSFLTTLNLGNLPLLKNLDIRNCPNLTGSLNLSSCNNLETLRAEGTALTGVIFANNGKIATVYLPNTINSLTMRNLGSLSTLNASLDNLESLVMENGVLDSLSLIEDTYDTLQTLNISGIDWTLEDSDLLDSLLGINSSVIAGSIYVPVMKQSKLSGYNARWGDDLNITYGTFIDQFEVKFLDSDGETVLYTEWVDANGTVVNPKNVFDDYVTPTKATDERYVYTFKNWIDVSSSTTYLESADNFASNVDKAIVYKAQYTATEREFTVTWVNGFGDTLKTSTVAYGSEAVWDFMPNADGIPTYTEIENLLKFYLFKGWDKSTGYITNNMTVTALWDLVSNAPEARSSTDTEYLNNASWTDIYRICAGYPLTINNYIKGGDRKYFRMGNDYSFNNVPELDIISESTYFNGSTAYEVTDENGDPVELFGDKDKSFTLCLDYEFTATTLSSTIMSISNTDNNSIPLRLQYSNGHRLDYGSANSTIGYSKNRNMLVIRHTKGEDKLYVYSFNPMNDTTFKDSKLVATLSNASITSGKLVLGGAEASTGFGAYAKGFIHKCKIWFGDLGDYVAKSICDWTTEEVAIKTESVGGDVSGRYALSDNALKNSSVSFMFEGLLMFNHKMNIGNYNYSTSGGKDSSGYYVYSGWHDTQMRKFLNPENSDCSKDTYTVGTSEKYTGEMGRVYKGLPLQLRALIKRVKTYSNVGASAGANANTPVRSDDDYIYLPSYYEMGGSGEPYAREGYYCNALIANSDIFRAKFQGRVVPEDATYYCNSSVAGTTQCSADPTTIYTVKSGDVWKNGTAVYIYEDAETSAKYNRVADGTLIVDADDGGLWVRAVIFWERSPIAAYSTNFCYVNYTGVNNNYGSAHASTSYGVCPCFSIGA